MAFTDLGTVKPGTTLYLPFHTFDSNDPSGSVTMSGLATSDIQIYKDGGTTQRASVSGYTLLDTDGIDFDSTTGIHALSIDLADNDTANFFEAGSTYWVVIATIAVDDAATVNFVLATFRIGYAGAILDTTIATLASQTSFTLEEGPADNDALNGCPVVVHDLASAVQVATGYVSDYVGSSRTVTLAQDPGIYTLAAGDNASFFMPGNMQAIAANTTNATNVGTAGANYSATRGLTGTALPAVAADAAGGVPISDAGGLDLDAILVDTATTIPNLINSITSSKLLLQNTTIATLASQTSFTLTTGSPDDDAYNGCAVVVTNQTTAAKQAVGVVSNYTGSSKTIVLASDPGIMTMAAGDTIDIVAPIGSMQDAQQHSVNLVVRDTSSANIADASVYVTSDISGAVRVASGLTSDDDGIVTLNLNKGLHYRWAQKTGKNFTNPQSFTVT